MRKERLDLLKHKILEDGIKLFWIFLYLWVLLGLFAVHKSIVLNEQNFFYHEGFAFINALLLAKVMLAAEILHVADNLRHKPLIYPILFKSAVFSMILISFYIIEEVLIGIWHGKPLTENIPVLGGGGLEGIFVVGIIMFVVLMPFFALREIGIALAYVERRNGRAKAGVVSSFLRSRFRALERICQELPHRTGSAMA